MTNPITWHSYLTRIGGKLVTVPTLADVPVCETCGGRGAGIGCGADPHTFHECDACHGTGRAWAWQVQPTAGMLVKFVTAGTWHFTSTVFYAPIGDKDRIHLTGRVSSELVSDCTPLAPPPLPGVTLTELLGLLPDCEVEDGVAYIRYYDRAGRIVGYTRAQPNGDVMWMSGQAPWAFDTAPLELALQRHKALRAYIAAWGVK